MHVTLTHDFSFEAARRLPHLGDGHPCGRIHGHSFGVQIALSGVVTGPEGWLMDYHVIEREVQGVIDQLDHRLLNEVEGLSNPTSEWIAAWLWDRLVEALPGLDSVSVMETPRTRVIYRGPTVS